jgi:hypothetical protein
LAELRPDGVAIVDAFDIPDRVLNSTLGRSDGNVYESLYMHALTSELNTGIGEGNTEPFDGLAEHLKPHLDPEFLKLHNKMLPEANL